jgi:uracil-DNA glycosylase family 4
MINPCPSCPRRFRPISGDGPQPCEFLIIGERPGQNENKYGKVFIGKTGEELNETYLPLANLHRSDVRICNAVLCWAEQNRTPTDKEVLECSRHHLPREIEHTRPSVIILMGGSACRMVPGIKLDTHHGIPQWGTLYGWEGIIVPMYHPALGLHESKWMTHLISDWSCLQSELAHTDSPSQSRPTDYRVITGKEVNDVPLPSLIAVDTESHGREPFSLQFSPSPGRSYMLMARDKVGLELFNRRVQGIEVALHNAVHDLDECVDLGVRLQRYRDTMQEAYHQGDLPQGLKPLVYRLFRVTMTSWEDVVRPASIHALVEWMVEALDIAQADLSLIDVKRLKTKIKETVKKGPLESLLNRLIRCTDVALDYDPWERLDEFWVNDAYEWMTSHVEARIGPYPILGIGNAPLTRAIKYACGDADWTLQAAGELERRRSSPYWSIAPTDRD